MNLTSKHFSEFFQAVYGYEPFPWQNALAEKVCDSPKPSHGQWPTCLALPTGSGKTSCIDIALFALACQSELPDDQRTAPRRIIFAVDRTVIVNEAFQHSQNLAGVLRDADRGILLEVATRLRTLAGGKALQQLLPPQMLSSTGKLLPLTCHHLRGAVYRDDAWARTPLQPCVIASTVDQIGSRLLFRGYGCSFKSWPLHAGLAATDSLIILDETHCAQPFLQTLQSVQHFRARAKEQVGGPFQFAIMSAMPPEDVPNGQIHRISDADLKHRVLGPRIRTEKPVRLVPSKAAGVSAQADLAVELAQQAAGLIDEQRQAIAIFVNRLPTGRHCHRLLEAVRDPTVKEVAPFTPAILNRLRKVLPEQYDVVLMTGRMRSIDMADACEDWPQRLNAIANPTTPRSLARPVIVVATQCLEVAANMDFDGLVSECASFDALRQRFGRLNRSGRNISALGVVTVRSDQVSEKQADPIYGRTLAQTWKLLQTKATNGLIDFGCKPMDSLWQSLNTTQRQAVIPQSNHAAVMLPAHLDMLCQTSPAPIPSPAPAVFLHGLDRGRQEIQVCWRADLIDHSGQIPSNVARRLVNAVSHTPPTSMECMSVPLAVFRRWLTATSPANVRDATSEISDTSTGSSAGNNDRRVPQHTVVIWRGGDSRVIGETYDNKKQPIVVPLIELRPGDTVVLPVSAAGFDVFGHIPNPNRPIDVADWCFLETRQRASIRLHPATLDAIQSELNQTPSDGTDSVADDTQAALAAVDRLRTILQTMNEEPDRGRVNGLLLIIAGGFDQAHWLPRSIDSDPFGRRALLETVYVAAGGKLLPTWQIGLRGSRRVVEDREEPEDLKLTRSDSFTGDDEVNSNTVAVTLTEHTAGVRNFADVFAQHAGLSATAYRQAAELHDLGKADVRFHAFLLGGDRIRASLNSHTPLAKSPGLNDIQTSPPSPQLQSEMPLGFRHELLSLQLATERNLLVEGDSDRDLVLHLLATHHGYCRPFAPVVLDVDPEPLDMSWHAGAAGRPTTDGLIDSVDSDARAGWMAPHQIHSGVAERFWRLVDRYGWWGIAWLEAVFVLADRRCSEAEQFGSPSDSKVQNATQQELTL